MIPAEIDVIAEVMTECRGDLVKVSRDSRVSMGVMQLRQFVQANPQIRAKYHENLAFELQDRGLHIAERILKMAELQETAFTGGYEIIDGERVETPPDPKMAIELSKEISRLIAESKGNAMSSHATVMVASKESAAELLQKFLES